MAIFEVQAQFQDVVLQLTRIADALDRLNPPMPLRPATTRKRDKSGIVNYGDNTKAWLSENITNLIHERGLAPAAEEELLNRMLTEYQPEDSDEQAEQ